MQYFFATWLRNDGQREVLRRAKVRTRLFSFIDADRFDRGLFEELRREGVVWLCDSGAFSAHTRGLQIDFAEYLRFLGDHVDLFENIFVLDIIAGRRGGVPTREESEEACRVSFANYLTMREAGFRPLPVYHQFDAWHWLWRYLDEGQRYLGISCWKTSQEVRRQEQRAWLEDVFAVLPAGIRTHGLGVSSPTLLNSFPWHTADGATWARHAKNGAIFVPRYDNGEPNYLRPSRPTVSNANWRSWKTWQTPPPGLGRFLRESGTTFGAVADDVYERTYVNAFFYKRLEQTINAQRQQQ